MTIESFKLAMPGQFFVFISTKSPERLSALEEALNDLGAKVLGPQSFALRKDKTTPDDIRDALGNLEEGECIYVISAAGDVLENHLLAPPRLEGGIIIG
ncbi:MAG: hypothetical protein CMN73_09695 [Sphingomonas sp.]|nr:hypothetical protein [Sphingomonas sp.]